jgi:hypothetical protein
LFHLCLRVLELRSNLFGNLVVFTINHFLIIKCEHADPSIIIIACLSLQ